MDIVGPARYLRFQQLPGAVAEWVRRNQDGTGRLRRDGSPPWLASGATQAACSVGLEARAMLPPESIPKVAAAGDTFSSRVAAALWTAAGDADFSDNPVAPSYSGNVTLSAVLQAPQAGATGSLTTNAATLSNGTSPSFTQAWSQSGALRIQAAGTYLGQSVSSQTPVIGRIVPRFFRTRLTTAACGAGAGALPIQGSR